MTVTRASLIEEYPEYADTPAAIVNAKIAAAVNRCDDRVFGDSFDHAVTLLACHLLAISPYGQQARVESKDDTTTYSLAFDALVRERAGGPHLLDGCS